MRVLSLFSGVGGFDMGLEAAGMVTAFQCEIDKHARSVLDHHWPNVPKWGDITTLTGAHILEATGGVDVVAWGSPCQDLSVAGKRAGLAGEKSGLFYEGIRIIKELRELTNGQSPTWSIWENVAGALSSNNGADFGQVLYEMEQAGACFSEWALLDAQYFGVPQRRRRVFLASCFDPAISERCSYPFLPLAESLPGDSKKGRKKGQDTSATLATSIAANGELGSGNDIANTISASLYHHGTVVNQDANNGHVVIQPTTFTKSRRAQSVDDYETWVESDVTPTLNIFDVGDIRTTTAVVEPVAYPIQGTIIGRSDTAGPQGRGIAEDGEPMYTLDRASMHGVAHEPIVFENSYRDGVRLAVDGVTQTLSAKMGTGGNNTPMVTQEQNEKDGEPIVFQPGTMIRLNGGVWEGGPAPTLRAYGKSGDNEPHIMQEETNDPIAFSHTQGLDCQPSENHFPTLRREGNGHAVMESTLIVRRLTPLECERLMGWPDHHTAVGVNGAVSDSQRYKMCGNGVVSSVAAWVAKQIMNMKEEQ